MATRLAAGGIAAGRLMLRCWGDFALTDAHTGEDIKPRGRKGRALLAYLAMHPGKPVSRAKLTGLLWGERGEDQARASLRQTLFELRPFGSGDLAMLRVDRELVLMVEGALDTDLDVLDRLARDGDDQALLSALPDPDDTLFANLEGVAPGFDDWLRIERTRQRDALITLVADASAGALAAGRTRAARALHARLTELAPELSPAATSVVSAEPAVASSASGHAAPAAVRRGRVSIAAAMLFGAAATGAAIWFQFGDPPPAIKADREVTGLVDAAREIIYQRKSQELSVATGLLRRAVLLQPDHPPALTGLAAALAIGQPSEEDRAEAERLVRRAIALDPRSAQAHGTLGMVLGFEAPEARAAIRQAALLDPNNAEILFWLSNILDIEGNFSGRLDALRRAVKADPTWHRATGTAALAAAEMGHSEEAAGYAQRLRTVSRRLSFLCAYAIDWSRGDYADVVRETLPIRSQLQQADAADAKMGNALLILGELETARLLLRLTPDYWRIASGGPPSSDFFAQMSAEADSDAQADDYFEAALRQVFNAGRQSEIVALYDRADGRLGKLKSPDAHNRALLAEGVDVALALRSAGRAQEADVLLGRVNRVVRQSLAYGPVPHWFHVTVAQLRAARGERAVALASLATAIDRGWHYAPRTARPDIAEIPAFRTLRGDPRFEQLRGRLKDHIARERRELGTVRL